ncbi:sensor histidine kinase [Gayadomonas joobiniege]|uniref:sensor histidine kinase n=1 Tax=Gayadomonas joobiniege TaxID=1234606 RepID=UPI0003661F10|nr:HAMP domain-containing sensor histidine kinase [Gayadomonas joobiniege]
MFKTLGGQLSVVCGAMFIIAAVVLSHWYMQSSEQLANQVKQDLHKDLAHHIVYDDVYLKQGIIDTEKLKQAFHTQMLLGPEWEFYALDVKGRVLAYSAPPAVVKLSHINLSPVKHYLAENALPIYGDDPRTPGKRKIFSAAPITNEQGQLTGYLYVIVGGQKLDSLYTQLSQNKWLKDSALVIFIALVFTLVVLLFAIRVITRPLSQLSEKALAYVNNDFARLSQVGNTGYRSKEIQNLEYSFINAAEHIKRQLKQIKNTEELRRELLSHISHDFKTPLAALNGYLETWMISEPSQRSEKLIGSALKNGNQIVQLVDQLFELSRLKSGDIQFTPEPVNLVELTYDVIHRLQLQADQSQVDLTVESAQSDLMVVADIAKLERILVNLIDNAIRHTPTHGRVKISVKPEQTGILVSVQDNGKGIPDAEISKIFEPKFQASNSEKSSDNQGLGLSIVQHLLQLHGSHVEVDSETGKGSCFSFNLQAC